MAHKLFGMPGAARMPDVQLGLTETAGWDQPVSLSAAEFSRPDLVLAYLLVATSGGIVGFIAGALFF